MLSRLDIAIGEMGYLQIEINTIKWELEHPDEDFPLSERCRTGLLIRLGVLNNGYKYLERMVISGLCELPIPDYNKTPKAQ